MAQASCLCFFIVKRGYDAYQQPQVAPTELLRCLDSLFYKQAAPPGLFSFISAGIRTVVSHRQTRTGEFCPCLYTRLYCLSGLYRPYGAKTTHSSRRMQCVSTSLCRPSGAKTTGISLYPPLAQWATVVTPRWGVFVMLR